MRRHFHGVTGAMARISLRRWAVVLALVVGAVWMVSAAPAVGYAIGVGPLQPIPSAKGIVFDESRGVLYVSSGSVVRRWDPVSARELTPIVLGGACGDIDISGDAHLLAVTNACYEPGWNWVDLVDLSTMSARRVQSDRISLEVGTASVAVASDGSILYTTDFAGSGSQPCWLRRFDPVSGSVSRLAEIADRDVIEASGDRGVIHTGDWRYEVASGVATPQVNQTYWNLFLAVNRDGSRIAMPGYHVLRVLDASGAPVRDLPESSGAAFSHDGRTLYLALTDSSSITGYDTANWEPTVTIPFPSVFGRAQQSWDVPSWLQTSDDGGLLFATVSGGVHAIRLRPQIQGTVRSSARGVPLAGLNVEVWRATDGLWSLDTTTTTGDTGSWRVACEPGVAARVRVVDPTGTHEPAWIGGTDVVSASDVMPTDLASASSDVTLTCTSTGRVEGSALSSLNHGSLAGVTVTVRPDTDRSSVLTTVATGADGAYDIDGLPAGRYALEFADPTGAHLTWWSGDASAPTALGLVNVRPGAATTADSSLPYIPYGLHGTVTSRFDGGAIPGAVVEVWQRGAGGVYTLVKTSLADVAGMWSASIDSNEPVRVRVSDPTGFAGPLWLGGEDLDSAADTQPTRPTFLVAGLSLPLTRPGAIAGVVRSDRPGNPPVAGIHVSLMSGNYIGNVRDRTVTTGSDGKYAFGGFGRPGARWVHFDDPRGAHVAQWADGTTEWLSFNGVGVTAGTTTTADVTMTFIPAYLTGTVRSSFYGLPVAGAKVEVWRPDAIGRYSFEQTVTADAEGNWTLETDDTPAIRLRVVDPLGFHATQWIGGTSRYNATEFHASRIGEAPRADVTLTLANPGSITGSVTSSLDGSAVAGATVFVLGDDSMGDVFETATADGDGRYTVTGLGPGRYQVGILDESGKHEFWSSADWIEITTPGPLTLDAELAFVPASVCGYVSSSSGGLPVPDAVVELWESSGGSWSVVTTVGVDADGWFEVQRESVIPVRLHMTDPSGMHDPVWWGGADIGSAADVVTGWGDASFADVSMVLRRPAHVAGTVRSAYSGQGIANVSVTLARGPQGYAGLETTTSADGSYSFDAVPPGDFRLLFYDEAERYDWLWWDGADSLEAAAPVLITSPVSLDRSVRLEPIVTDWVWFDWADIVPGYSEEPWLGQATAIDGWVYDVPMGVGGDGTALQLEWSRDGATWARWDGPATLTVSPDGYCRASFVPTDTAPVRYRLSWRSGEFVRCEASNEVLIQARQDKTHFGPARLASKGSAGPETVFGGEVFSLQAMLYGSDGQTPDRTTPVREQVSTDGLQWVDRPHVPGAGMVYTVLADGTRSSEMSLFGRLWVRFVAQRPSDGSEVYSPPAFIYPRTQLEVYSGTRARRGRVFTISGIVYAAPENAMVTIEYRKPGSRRWVVLTQRPATWGTWWREGTWSLRYRPRYRGTYFFRARVGDNRWGRAAVSRTCAVRVR